ncbi:hypothetical protein [Idiomarina xiamenensis]|uniref:Type II secretory pathway component n=1 Tax=Idiomarina xiamenensis 10-D-4 TaxID=740709 RepID=K2KF72_9GAMM|nr:hypothetical protein [Idiomarina xiamenensis]EKE85397.1 Type II secretory pathway component [Idiomarina xiamenensis 10-D-4]
MSPNSLATGQQQSRQRGSALVVAIFVIVVIGALVAALARVLGGNSQSVVYEVLGTRTFFAAQSGLQHGLTELFPLNSSVAPSCSAVTAEPALNAANDAFAGCQVSVICRDSNMADSTLTATDDVIFQLQATATCQADEVQTQRRLVTEARVLQP